MTDPVSGKSPSSPRASGWGSRERWLVGSNVAVMILVAIAIYFGVNFVSFHQFARADWSESKLHTISPDTKGLLSSLTEDVKVIAIYSPERPTDLEVIPLVNNLLDEYAVLSDHVKIERIDYDRDRERVELLGKQYNLSEPNVVIFGVGDKKKVVPLSDVAEIEFGGGGPFGGGSPDRLKAFKGEQEFSSAIRSVTEGKKTTVYFLQGHGESSPDSFEGDGLSEFSKRLKRDNYAVEPLNLLAPKEGQEKGIPKDCDVLVVAGPTKDATGDEIEGIREYLELGGKLLLLTDALETSNILEVAAPYGMKFGTDPVVLVDFAPNRFNPYSGQASLVASDNFAFDHPVTKAFRTNGVCIFSNVRPIEVGAAPAGAMVSKLVSTSVEQSYAKRVVDGAVTRTIDPEDKPGPHCYAAAAEKAGSDPKAPPTRVVAFGDTGFALNGSRFGASYGIRDLYHEELLSNCVDWLAGKEQYFDIAPKSTERRIITMTEELDHRFLWYAVLAMPVFLGVALGGAVWFVRRR